MITKMLLMSKNQTRADGKSKFRKFFTYMDIEVKGEEDKGLQSKSLTVKFDKTIDTSKFIRGVITLDENDYDAPYKYEVKEEVQQDGSVKLKYPRIYVKKIIKYEDRKPKSTGQFNLMDEAETDEIEIDDNEE